MNNGDNTIDVRVTINISNDALSFLCLYIAANSTNDRRRVKLVDSRESAISPNLSGRIVAWRMDAVNYSARASYKCMKRRERFPTRGSARLNFTFQSSTRSHRRTKIVDPGLSFA